ncbi:MAG: SDR family NAD(P)-dependent oxidoreductase [Bacteroidetes bacterium]|nr:SDR family NAD(P)-dependent oxidoreductase [Bacteroidota bacterium]
MKKTALITGATSGIGKATATKLAENGTNIIITGRRKNLLIELGKKLRSQFNVEVLELVFDIRDQAEVFKQIKELPDNWKQIDILVNNAGLAAGLDRFQDADIDDWETMIDTNVKGLLYISKAVIPLMIKRSNGHIVNISSTAGKEVYLKGNVYCATKHAVDAINKAMRIDLLEEGVKITSVSPGMVETEFSLVRFKGNREKAAMPYKGIKPLSGEDVADVIWFVLNRPDHVNINEIIITPKAQANSIYINRKERE